MKKSSDEGRLLSRRGFMKGAVAATMTGLPELSHTKSVSFEDPTGSIERPLWLEKITNQNIDYEFGFTSNDEINKTGEALVIIDWQEYFINPEVNEHTEVQKQLLETQEAIIDRVITAKEEGQIIVLVGVNAGGDGEAEDLLKTGGSRSDIPTINPQYPREIIDLVDGYDNVHYMLKDYNSVADERSESRSVIENILETVSQVRVVGVNESICGWRSVNDIASSSFGGTGKRVILNPSELADTQRVLEGGLDAQEMYVNLPKNMVFQKALALFFDEKESAMSDIEVIKTIHHEDGRVESVVLTFSDIEEDFIKYIETNELPSYFK